MEKYRKELLCKFSTRSMEEDPLLQKLVNKEHLTIYEKGYIVTIVLENIEESEIKVLPCWEDLGYDKHDSKWHKGYYNYTETWLCIDNYQLLLLDSTYDHEQFKELSKDNVLIF